MNIGVEPVPELFKRTGTGSITDYSTIFLSGAIVFGVVVLSALYIFANRSKFTPKKRKSRK